MYFNIINQIISVIIEVTPPKYPCHKYLTIIATKYDMNDACGINGPMEIRIYDDTDITSPGYPRHYSSNLNCTWKVIASKDPPRKVHLIVEDVAMDDE